MLDVEMDPVSPDWQQAKNILCVRMDAMGDVLMTSPALRAIKHSLKGCQLTLLTSSLGAEAGALIPEVDEVLTFDPAWMKATPLRKNSRAELALIRKLKSRRFDGAVIFTVYSQNPLPAALMCYLADIPLRSAFCRENPYQLLTHWAKEIEPEQMIRHEVQRQIDLVKTLGMYTENEKMGVHIDHDDHIFTAALLVEKGIDLSRPWLVIHPGSSAPSRRYQPSGYAKVGRQLALEDGFQVVWTGLRSELSLIGAIQDQMGVSSVSLAGLLTLKQLAALLSLAPLLVANNTGPVHLAAAVGTPVVDVYALTNPQHTPWGIPHRVIIHDVPCKYCYKSVCPLGHHDCLRLIEPGTIVSAVRDLLREVGLATESVPLTGLMNDVIAQK